MFTFNLFFFFFFKRTNSSEVNSLSVSKNQKMKDKWRRVMLMRHHRPAIITLFIQTGERKKLCECACLPTATEISTWSSPLPLHEHAVPALTLPHALPWNCRFEMPIILPFAQPDCKSVRPAAKNCRGVPANASRVTAVTRTHKS